MKFELTISRLFKIQSDPDQLGKRGIQRILKHTLLLCSLQKKFNFNGLVRKFYGATPGTRKDPGSKKGHHVAVDTFYVAIHPTSCLPNRYRAGAA